jgi:hypothetical protein
MPTKRIVISGHARFEMKRRRIRQAEVVAAIRFPEQIVPSRKGRHIYQILTGSARRLLLRVVVKEVRGTYHVVTAYKTSKIAKYWIAQ